MATDHYQPSAVDLLAAVIKKKGSSGYSAATVQRSHRFPLHLIAQIENMAQEGDVPVSLILNRLIECGLDAVKQKLSQEEVDRIETMSPAQIAQPSTPDTVGIPPKKASGKATLKTVKK